MGTSMETIRGWLERGKANEQAYVVVVCDTYDWEDYPCYCKDYEHLVKTVDAHDGKNMQRIMEAYDLSTDIEPQLHQHRAGGALLAEVRAEILGKQNDK